MKQEIYSNVWEEQMTPIADPKEYPQQYAQYLKNNENISDN
jgi:hypothetical protein